MVITCPVEIQAGVTLTIEPSIFVKSEGDEIDVEGTLWAEGTAAEPVTFTSVGGDTDPFGIGDEDGSPRSGDWGGIYFSDAKSTELANLDLRYAATANDVGLLASMNISDTDFAYDDAAIAVRSTAENDPASGALACVPPYLSFVTLSHDWFGSHGAPAADIDISGVIGNLVPDEYSPLFWRRLHCCVAERAGRR